MGNHRVTVIGVLAILAMVVTVVTVGLAVASDGSTIAGGVGNVADGHLSSVGGGRNNKAMARYDTISGGWANTTWRWGSTVAGGMRNKATGGKSTVGGGQENTASGISATVPGGERNTASGDYSFAAGRRAKALNDGSFVWGGSTDADFTSTADDQFLVRAPGGVGIGRTASPAEALDVTGNVHASGVFITGATTTYGDGVITPSGGAMDVGGTLNATGYTEGGSDTLSNDIFGTAASLAADGADCAAGSYARGVDESGNAQGCTEVDIAALIAIIEELQNVVFGGNHMWSKALGGTESDEGSGIAVDGSGDLLLTGFFRGTANFGGGDLTSSGVGDIFVAKFSGTDGSHQWSKGFGDTAADRGFGIAVDASGDVLVTGIFNGTVNFGGGNLASSGLHDIFVAKFSGTDGSHMWSKRFGGTGNDIGWGIAVDGSGDVLVTGYFKDTLNFGGGNITSNGAADIFVAKFSGTDGSHVWSKGFGSTTFDIGHSIAVDGSGDVVVTGIFGAANFGGGDLTSNGSNDIFVAKFLGTDGSHQWSKGFGDTADDRGFGIAVDASGDVLVTGVFFGTVDFGGADLTSNFSDIFVAKLSGANGSHIWSKGFGDTNTDQGMGIAVDGSGDVVVTGVFRGTVEFRR